MILHKRDTLKTDGPPSTFTFDEQSGDLCVAVALSNCTLMAVT